MSAHSDQHLIVVLGIEGQFDTYDIYIYIYISTSSMIYGQLSGHKNWVQIKGI